MARMGGAEQLLASVGKSVEAAAMSAAREVPSALGVTARAFVKLTIFYLTLATLFQKGAAFAEWGKRMSPLSQEHTVRLFQVFVEISRNVVLAGLGTSLVQGAVAWLGYRIAGAEQPLLFGVLTGVFSVVPVVGSAIAWVPVATLLLLEDRQGAPLFVVIWSMAVTGTVDNLIKPFMVRGGNDIPALLIFVAVFGGLTWMGVVGILVGPILMALLLALFKIHDEEALSAAAS